MVRKIKNLIKPSWFISKKEIEYYYIEGKLKETNELVSRLENKKTKLEEENQLLLHNFFRNGIRGVNEYYYVDNTYMIKKGYSHQIKIDYQMLTNRLGFTERQTIYRLVEEKEKYIFKGTKRECECFIEEIKNNLDIKEQQK